MQTKAQVHLDRDSTPLFRQTAEILRERILSGEYAPESILPSERELSESLGVSRVPVREAIKALEYVGIVKQERGRGVVVQRADPGASSRRSAPSSRRFPSSRSSTSSTCGFSLKAIPQDLPRAARPKRT